MVRLVFRPYAQLRRSICTSESLRASTGVSPGFALVKHSSLSFGSQRVRSRCSRGASASRVAPANVRPLEEPRACASLPWKPPAATAGRQCVRGANALAGGDTAAPSAKPPPWLTTGGTAEAVQRIGPNSP